MKKLYILNYGCDMNRADSEAVRGMLDREGYILTDNEKEADFIFVNTCSIRDKSEEKVYSKLGELGKLKQANPELILTVGGCVAQQEGRALAAKAPFVDIVMGTHNIHTLPELLDIRRSSKKEQKNEQFIQIVREKDNKVIRNQVISVWDEPLADIAEDMPVIRDNPWIAKVNIIYGCNYKCTYCIVPTTRGVERSRHPDDICREVEQLAADGYKEIHLLGQNVNSYGQDLKLDKRASLAVLLNSLVKIDGIERIRFFTSHPKDITLELIEAMKHPKVCDWLHLPVQSGDDEVLELMARQHDTDYYRNLISELKEAVPTLCLSSDIIVGFPGETREQFENTLRFVEEMEFEWVNTAAFSKRPGTPAENMTETISETEKYRWLHELNAFVKAQVYKYNQKLVGNTYSILIEGVSRENPDMLLGKTTTGKTIFVEGSLSEYGGRIVNVRVTKAASWVIYGEMI